MLFLANNIVISIDHGSNNCRPLAVGLSGNLTDFLGPLLTVLGDGSSVANEVWGPVAVGLCVGVGFVSVYAIGFLVVLRKLVAVGWVE